MDKTDRIIVEELKRDDWWLDGFSDAIVYLSERDSSHYKMRRVSILCKEFCSSVALALLKLFKIKG